MTTPTISTLRARLDSLMKEASALRHAHRQVPTGLDDRIDDAGMALSRAKMEKEEADAPSFKSVLVDAVVAIIDSHTCVVEFSADLNAFFGILLGAAFGADVVDDCGVIGHAGAAEAVYLNALLDESGNIDAMCDGERITTSVALAEAIVELYQSGLEDDVFDLVFEIAKMEEEAEERRGEEMTRTYEDIARNALGEERAEMVDHIVDGNGNSLEVFQVRLAAIDALAAFLSDAGIGKEADPWALESARVDDEVLVIAIKRDDGDVGDW